MKYVQEAGQRSQKIEKIKQEKQAVCKRALLQKAKRDRLVRKLKLQGELQNKRVKRRLRETFLDVCRFFLSFCWHFGVVLLYQHYPFWFINTSLYTKMPVK